MAQYPGAFKKYEKPRKEYPKLSPDFELGFHQYLNFGKFKPTKGQRRTFYDLANMGEYGYLKWCLQQCTSKRPKIKIRTSCHAHIEASLQNENGQSPWIKKNIIEDHKVYTQYVAYNQAGKEVTSPRIELRYCKGCDQSKCAYMFSQDDEICDTCMKVKSQPIPYQEPKEPIRNQEIADNSKRLEAIDEDNELEELDRTLRLRKMMRERYGNRKYKEDEFEPGKNI